MGCQTGSHRSSSQEQTTMRRKERDGWSPWRGSFGAYWIGSSKSQLLTETRNHVFITQTFVLSWHIFNMYMCLNVSISVFFFHSVLTTNLITLKRCVNLSYIKILWWITVWWSNIGFTWNYIIYLCEIIYIMYTYLKCLIQLICLWWVNA